MAVCSHPRERQRIRVCIADGQQPCSEHTARPGQESGPQDGQMAMGYSIGSLAIAIAIALATALSAVRRQ